jgi:hypothetical protein
VATVRTDGMLVARAGGTARIEARAGGRAGSVTVTVVAAELLPAHIEIPPSVTLRLGGVPITWSVQNADIAGIDHFGRVRGRRAGVTRVTAAAGNASASVELTVFARQPAARAAGSGTRRTERFLHLSETHLDQQEKTMNWLVILAIVFITLWILAEVLGFVIGAALHLLWIAALVLLAVWLFQKMRTRV